MQFAINPALPLPNPVASPKGTIGRPESDSGAASSPEDFAAIFGGIAPVAAVGDVPAASVPPLHTVDRPLAAICPATSPDFPPVPDFDSRAAGVVPSADTTKLFFAVCPGFAPVAESEVDADTDTATNDEDTADLLAHPKGESDVLIAAVCPAWLPEVQPALPVVDPTLESSVSDQPGKFFVAVCPAEFPVAQAKAEPNNDAVPKTTIDRASAYLGIEAGRRVTESHDVAPPTYLPVSNSTDLGAALPDSKAETGTFSPAPPASAANEESAPSEVRSFPPPAPLPTRGVTDLNASRDSRSFFNQEKREEGATTVLDSLPEAVANTPAAADTDLPIFTPDAGASAPRTGARDQASRAIEPRTLASTVQLSVAAKFAEKLAAPSSSGTPEAESVIKKSLGSAAEAVKSLESPVGTGIAKTQAAMSAATLYPPDSPATPAPGAAFVAPAAVDFRANEMTNAHLPTEAVARSAEHAVEAVLSAAERFANGDRHAVNLEFSIGGTDLHVRVEMRADEVHTAFRTGSAELRAALTQEWQAVNAQPGERSMRFVAPVFSASVGGDSSTSGFSGDTAWQQHREPAARDDAPYSFSRFSRAASANPTVDTTKTNPPPIPAWFGPARRLQTFA